MPVTVRAGLLLAALWAAGCSGGGGGGTSGDSDAGPGDGGSCHALDAGCSVQADCGEPADGIHVYTCESGRCSRQAGFGRNCSTVLPLPQVQISLSGWGTNPPRSFEIRAYYPDRVDGSPVTCADVVHTADFPDGGSPLEVDATLNVENVSAAQATCTSSGSCTYLTNLSLVPGNAPVILVQAYSGGRDPSGTHTTGIQLGDGCTEGTTVVEAGSGAPQNFQVTVTPES